MRNADLLYCGSKRAAKPCEEVPTAERHRFTCYRLGAAAFVAGVFLSVGAAPAFAGAPGPVPTSAVPSAAQPTVRPGPPSPDGGSPAHTATGPGSTGANNTKVHLASEQGALAASQPASGGSAWSGGGIGATTVLTVPIALGGLVAVFMVAQWLIDRRDPLLSEAPTRREENSVAFE